MGKLVVSLDGVVIKEVQITKDKTTLGRRPYNDIVIDNLAVSGEHAVMQMVGADVFIEDLNSTNGTYINGKAIKKQLLSHNDTVEIGKYKIKYLVEDGTDYEKTMIMKPGSAASSAAAYAPTAGFGASGAASFAGSGGGALGFSSSYHSPVKVTPAVETALPSAKRGL
jgi:pSer/pThr/pTyr-binding forkhead associated (FHA) protein